ncbi:MAG: TetR/AcrR family transcriptional regulator [Proteobacteria bacterium]|nr:MAG: TetR/AcrR family transcriptional regulator [Pseudomonadota bacterium]
MDNATRKSDATRRSILEAAREVFMDQGYNRFTMRKVAAAASMSLGNLNYHFPRKDGLLKALLNYIIDAYMTEFDRRRTAAGESPTRQLEAVLNFWIDDLLARDTTIFFPELWALANHDRQVAEMTDDLYQRACQPLTALIPLINPGLSAHEVNQIAHVMCASMEGLTMFAGHEKPWSTQHADLKRLMVQSFFRMIHA